MHSPNRFLGFAAIALAAAAVLAVSVARPACLKNSPFKPNDSLDPLPFYTPPARSEFRRLAKSLTPVTDKVGASSIPAAPNNQHTYDALYSKYFEVKNQRFRRLKLLEIGLGCNMDYGPGASAQVWRKYLPNAEVWFAEFDAACVSKYAATLQQLNISAVTGDQGDNATLARWVQETGGNFDVIIDDGGHTGIQQFNSFATLFFKALKPGGVYFIEDLQVSHRPEAEVGGPPIMAKVITDWVESLLASVVFSTLRNLNNRPAMQPGLAHYRHWQSTLGYLAAWKLPSGVKMLECAAEMCAIVKCTEDDELCPDGMAKGTT